MQIDTNVSLDELPDNHPIPDVLNDKEKALYPSVVQNIVAAAEDIEEKFEPESSELTETTNQLRAAITLSELVEEVAEGRKQGFSKDDQNIHAGEQ